MKKTLALILALVMMFSLVACGGDPAPEAESTAPEAEGGDTSTPDEPEAETEGDIEITLWTYPIGTWGGTAPTADAMIDNFEAANPGIIVNVEYLDYTSGDDQVMSAINGETTPDIIMEGPERLVANWGAAGKMVDISDLWTDEVIADIEAISPAVVEACQSPEGIFYEMPLAMTTHTMAINYDMFEAAGALQYIDEETRTWTTENFLLALEAIRDSGVAITPAIVYCGGQGGDQGTRALVNNLYSGQYTNADFTEYTANSAENVMALDLLVQATADGLLSSDASFQAADDLLAFQNGTSAMTFCWNSGLALSYPVAEGFTPYPMAFPSDDGVPELAGGMWGFGIFDNGDEAKIEAAKTFITYMTSDPVQGPESVLASGFFPVRASQGNIYEGTERGEELLPYISLMPYLGDYYNVIDGWPEQRVLWWNMLQQVFAGTPTQEAADDFVSQANANIG